MIDPFRKINEKEKTELLKNLEADTYTFDKNVSILSKVRVDQQIGILLEGQLHIIRSDYNGNKTIVEELSANDVFGTRLSFSLDHEYDIVTKTPCRIIALEYHNIINASSHSPYYTQFIINLFEIVNNLISYRNDRIKVLTQKTIRNKLLEYFNVMATKQRSRTFYLPFSFTDLADYLAIDRSAMTREMKHLKEEKIIEVRGKRITLKYK